MEDVVTLDKPLTEQILLQASRMHWMGRLEESGRLFDEGIAAFENLFGKVSRDRSAALQLRAEHRREQDLGAAVAQQREATEGYKTVLGGREEANRRSWQILASMYREEAEALNRESRFDESSQLYRLEREAHLVAGAPGWRSRQAMSLTQEWRRFATLGAGDRARPEAALDAGERVDQPGGIEPCVKAPATFDELLG